MPNPTREEWTPISAALGAPFDPADVEFRPQTSKGEAKKAQAVCYVESRAIMDRLDAVVGAGNWSFDWTPLVIEKGEVQIAKGTLTLYGVAKSDVGDASTFSPSKGCVSDTLKRCAVLWGIGRYLYAVPSEWVELDDWGHIPAATLARLRAKLPRPDGQQRPAEQPTTQPPMRSVPRPAPKPAAPLSWSNVRLRARHLGYVSQDAWYQAVEDWTGKAEMKGLTGADLAKVDTRLREVELKLDADQSEADPDLAGTTWRQGA